MKKVIYFKLEYYEDTFTSKNLLCKFFINAIQMAKKLFFNVKMIENDEKIEYICYAKKNKENKVLKKMEKIIKNNPNTNIILSKKIKEIIYNIKTGKEQTNIENLCRIVEKSEENKCVFVDCILVMIKSVMERKRQMPEEQSLYILINSSNYNNTKLINELVVQYKTINIVTSNRKEFEKIEKDAEKNFEAISVLNNKRKSLKNAKYILNIDFSGDEIAEYSIYRNAVIFNTANTRVDKLMNFDGTIINNVKFMGCGEYDLKDEYCSQNEKWKEVVLKKILNNEYELRGNRGKVEIK